METLVDAVVVIEFMVSAPVGVVGFDRVVTFKLPHPPRLAWILSPTGLKTRISGGSPWLSGARFIAVTGYS